ncbi:MAG: hypothetical protein AAGI27_14635 [Pseudomonadota bacterium]
MKKPAPPSSMPNVIQILTFVKGLLLDRHHHSFPEETVELLNDRIDPILTAWSERESMSELRDALGLNAKKGRRRTARKFYEELEIANELYVLHRYLGTPLPEAKETILERFEIDEMRTLERIYESWYEWLDSEDRNILEIFGDPTTK